MTYNMTMITIIITIIKALFTNMIMIHNLKKIS
jgi:hypothetical protein